MLIHAGKKINLRQLDIAQADPGHYNTQYQGSRPCGSDKKIFFTFLYMTYILNFFDRVSAYFSDASQKHPCE